MNESDLLHAQNEDDAGGPGTTMVLTAEGWEASDYVEPADDWVFGPDGSLASPDGAIRTWLLIADAGETFA